MTLTHVSVHLRELILGAFSDDLIEQVVRNMRAQSADRDDLASRLADELAAEIEMAVVS